MTQTPSESRHSIRLPEYDYAQPGMVYVTMVTWRRECVFGEISDGIMQLNSLGNIILREWKRLPQRFPWVNLDEFIIMPNHFHGIIIINDEPLRRGAAEFPQGHDDRPHVTPGSIGAYVRAFKSSTTFRYNRSRFSAGTPLWQRNYYDHVVRNEADLQRIRQYIQNNPLQWELDQENPDRPKT